MWLAERFGWTLEYIDGLDLQEAYDIKDMVQSADLAAAHEQRKRARMK